MAITSSSTKKDLQAQNAELEAQVQSLQNELSQSALQLGELEDQLKQAQATNRDELVQDALLSLEREATDQYLDSLDGLASQFNWALAMFDSIMLYTPTDTDTRDQLNELLHAETRQFIASFEAGEYDSQKLIETLEQARLDTVTSIDPERVKQAQEEVTTLFNAVADALESALKAGVEHVDAESVEEGHED